MEPKTIYKRIRSVERSKSYYRPKLINILINLKSRNIMIYGKYSNIRSELVKVLRGTKSFEGDVVSYLLFLHPFASRNPSHYRMHKGKRYDPNKSNIEEQLPF